METNHSRGLGPEAMDYLCIRHQIYDLLRRLFIEEPTPELLSLVQTGGKGVRTDFPCGLEHAVQGSLARSAARRLGHECVSPCTSRRSTHPSQHKPPTSLHSHTTPHSIIS